MASVTILHGSSSHYNDRQGITDKSDHPKAVLINFKLERKNRLPAQEVHTHQSVRFFYKSLWKRPGQIDRKSQAIVLYSYKLIGTRFASIVKHPLA